MPRPDITDDHVPNLYRESLGRALPRAGEHVESVREAFAAVRRALDGGAWTGAAADAFAAELADVDATGRRSAEQCAEALRVRQGWEPALVAAGDPRARFA